MKWYYERKISFIDFIMESKVLKQVTHSIFEFFNVNKPQVVSGTQEHLDSVEIISAKEGPGMREGS